METNSEELINKTLLIVKDLNKKAQMFSKGVFIITILDCLFGLLAIFCTSLTVTAFFASATSLTVITIGGRVIQVSKIRNLEKSLKPLNLISIAWFVEKYKKHFKKGGSKVKTEKMSKIQIASIIGAVVGIIFAIVSALVPQIAIAGNCVYNILVATGIETLCAFAGTFKGYTKLTEEEISKLEEKNKVKEDARKQAEVIKAKSIIDKYEEAKKIVEEAENNAKQDSSKN